MTLAIVRLRFYFVDSLIYIVFEPICTTADFKNRRNRRGSSWITQPFPFELIIYNRIVTVFRLGSSPDYCAWAWFSALSNTGRCLPFRVNCGICAQISHSFIRKSFFFGLRLFVAWLKRSGGHLQPKFDIGWDDDIPISYLSYRLMPSADSVRRVSCLHASEIDLKSFFGWLFLSSAGIFGRWQTTCVTLLSGEKFWSQQLV